MFIDTPTKYNALSFDDYAEACRLHATFERTREAALNARYKHRLGTDRDNAHIFCEYNDAVEALTAFERRAGVRVTKAKLYGNYANLSHESQDEVDHHPTLVDGLEHIQCGDGLLMEVLR